MYVDYVERNKGSPGERGAVFFCSFRRTRRLTATGQIFPLPPQLLEIANELTLKLAVVSHEHVFMRWGGPKDMKRPTCLPLNIPLADTFF